MTSRILSIASTTELTNDFSGEPGDSVCTDSAFISPTKGWYLTLRTDEKVNYRAEVFSSHVYFTTFEPTEDVASNPPEICVPVAPSATPTPTAPPSTTPTPTPEPGGGSDSLVCRASGLGRFYNVGVTCGLGEYSEVNDVLIGMTTYTIGNHTYIAAQGSGAGSGAGGFATSTLTYDDPFAIISSTTNWRQE